MKRRILALIFIALVSVACKAPEPDDIHGAVGRGDPERIDRAIELGAEINEKKNGRTPLHTAVVKGKPEAVAHLLELGADPSLKDDKGYTPWQTLWIDDGMWRTRHEGACAIAMLEAGVEIPEPTGEDSYLHFAANRAECPALIKALVDIGEDVNGRGERSWTPLHVAAEAGYGENVSVLLALDADPNLELTETWLVKAGHHDTVRTKHRFEKGSRPLDVVRYGRGRAGESASIPLKEFGATSNPEVKNIKGPSKMRKITLRFEEER